MNDKQQTHSLAFTSKLKIHYTTSNFVATNSHLQYYHPSQHSFGCSNVTNVLAKHSITTDM